MTTASRQAPKVQSHAQERAGAPAPEFRNLYFYRAHAILSRLQPQASPAPPSAVVQKGASRASSASPTTSDASSRDSVVSQRLPARSAGSFPFLMRSRVLILCVNSVSPSIVSSATELNALLSVKIMSLGLHAMPLKSALEYAASLAKHKLDLVVLFCDNSKHTREFIALARKKSPLTRLVAVCLFSDVQARELAEVADLVISPPFYVSALYPQLERALTSLPKQATR